MGVRNDGDASSGHGRHTTARDDAATLPELFAADWRVAPGRPVLADGRQVVPAGELDDLTAGVAGVLRRIGVGRGDRVLWQSRATLGSVAALLGIVRAGAVLVPLSPSASAREVDHVVADAAPSAAVSEAIDVPAVTVWTVEGIMAEAARSRRSSVGLPTVSPTDDVLVVYTSGTTGNPKGAVHTHASLLAGVRSVVTAWEWGADDRLILALPLFHVHGLCAGLFGTLAAGASAVVLDRFREEAVVEAAATGTMFFGVPTMYHRLAASGRAAALAGLRLCVSGSAPLAADLWQGLHALGLDVLERYGMTETLLTLSNPLRGERRPGSVGLPLPGAQIALDGPDDEGVGELLVRAPSLCRGYWGRAGRLTDAAGWFATGDLASVAPDGYVTIRGRRTELIITGGHNVYPAEVESVLARHGSVAEVAVVGVPSSEWGETVVAFVVGRNGAPDLPALNRLAEEELAPFKRPRRLEAVDTLPRNAMGKVVRARLRDAEAYPRRGPELA
jgi:malonyl-CoA/methylmalonyl-CoA synthetase